MSTLFEFIQDVSEDLYQLVSDIENLLYEQPNTTLMKCRLFGEQLVKRISEHEKMEEVYPLNNAERIRKLYKQEIIDEDIYVKLEWLRKMGNKAAHDLHAADIEDAIKAHRFLYDISVWYMELYVSYDFVAPIYKLPLRQTNKPNVNLDDLLQPYIDETKKKIDSLWTEVNEELKQINQEKAKLAEEATEAIEQTNTKKKPFPIIDYLEKENLTYVDKRDKKGSLWIIGDWSLHEKLNELKKHKIYFRFTKKGGRSTDFQPAWFMLNKTLPIVEVEELEQKVPETKEQQAKPTPPISLDPVSDDYWIEKGQVLFPRHLEGTSIEAIATDGLPYLIENYEVTTCNDITEDLLREVYMKSKADFYTLTNGLYAQQFRFTGKLAALLHFSSNESDWKITVHQPNQALDVIFPARFRERLAKYNIKTLKDLDNMLFSTLVWMLKEDVSIVRSFIEQQYASSETTMDTSFKVHEKNEVVQANASDSTQSEQTTEMQMASEDTYGEATNTEAHANSFRTFPEPDKTKLSTAGAEVSQESVYAKSAVSIENEPEGKISAENQEVPAANISSEKLEHSATTISAENNTADIERTELRTGTSAENQEVASENQEASSINETITVQHATTHEERAQQQANTEANETQVEEPYHVSYNGETLTFSETFAHQSIIELDIQGCNMMLRRLIGKQMTHVKDLPEKLDGIHERLAGVGPKTVEKFWDELKEAKANMQEEIMTEQETDGFIVRFDQQKLEIPELVLDLQINPELFPSGVVSLVEAMEHQGIVLYRDLPRNLADLLSFRGVGRVKVKTFFQHLEALIDELVEEAELNQMSDEERLTYEFDQFITWYVNIKVNPAQLKKDKISPNYIEFVQKRHAASLHDKHVTLEELGQERGVTRERIRQILKKGDQNILQKWEKLVSLLTASLADQEMSVTNLDARDEAHYLLLHALEEMDVYYEKISDISFFMKKTRREFSEYVEEVLKDVRRALTKQVVTESHVKAFSEERALEDHVPAEIIEAIVQTEIKWLGEGQGVIKSMTKADIVEMVMLQYPKGVEIYKKEAELMEKANDLMPGGFTTERSFNSIIGRDDLQETFYMWGRGYAIHADFVHVDEKWLDSLIDLAASWLEEEEFIHIAKLYEAVEDEAKKWDIPNEYALYTLLRLRPQEKISFPRFPNVLPYGEDRLENHEWIVKFIEGKNRPVKVTELVEEFIENKGWRRFTLDFNLSKSTEIIPYEHAVYTLASFYEDVDKQKLQRIIDKLRGLMKEKSMIYFPAFYQENEMFLKSIGIPTEYVLYGILKKMDLDEVKFPRFPFAVSQHFSGDSVAVREMIEEFIREEDRIVAREEINLWLEELIGEGSRLLDLALLNSDKILYYSRGQYGEYIHRDTIEMDGEHVEAILAYASNKFAEVKRHFNRKYVFISELFSRDELPALPKAIQWSEELLSDILTKSAQWRIIGTYRAILTPVVDGIENEIEFIETILQKEFEGAAKLTDIRNFLSTQRYSKDGDFLLEVNEAIERGEAPFEIVGDELIHKQLTEGSYRS